MSILPHWRGGSFVGVISPYHSDSVVSQDHVIRVTSGPLASEHRRKVSVVLLWEKYTFKTIQYMISTKLSQKKFWLCYEDRHN